jgi:metallo-beta-lactamase class B
VSDRRLRDGTNIRSVATLAIVASVLTFGAPAMAQPFQGCPSKDILARFEEFGRTGKMPPEIGAWLGNPKAQYIEPWASP